MNASVIQHAERFCKTYDEAYADLSDRADHEYDRRRDEDLLDAYAAEAAIIGKATP